MPYTKSFIGVCLCLTVLFSPAHAEEAHPSAESASTVKANPFSLIPANSVTEHRLLTPEGVLDYVATAGTFNLYDRDDNRTAKIFYTAYTTKDKYPNRPVTFVFNGGPGASSAYLHLGLVGPKVIYLGEKNDDGTRPFLKDNPDSWLPFTDIVLIDPVGTGWSSAVSDEAAKKFYGVNEDAESIAKIIALYKQTNQRMASPTYLLGESYGGFRTAKVASALKNSQGILTSGIMMVSPLIDGQFIDSNSSPLSAAVLLPTLAAAEMERSNSFDLAKLQEAEQFAMTDYLVTLAGSPPSGQAADNFYQRISELTGVSKPDVTRAKGFLGEIYSKALDGNERIVSVYDAAYSAPDAYPESKRRHDIDPILHGFTNAFGSAFTAYANDELGFKTEKTYSVLNWSIMPQWKWGNGHEEKGSITSASVVGDLRELLSTIPRLRVSVFHGYADTVTPYQASRYALNHLPSGLAEGRTTLNLYHGGHMFYLNSASRHQLKEDALKFYVADKPNL